MSRKITFFQPWLLLTTVLYIQVVEGLSLEQAARLAKLAIF